MKKIIFLLVTVLVLGANSAKAQCSVFVLPNSNDLLTGGITIVNANIDYEMTEDTTECTPFQVEIFYKTDGVVFFTRDITGFSKDRINTIDGVPVGILNKDPKVSETTQTATHLLRNVLAFATFGCNIQECFTLAYNKFEYDFKKTK